MSTLRPPRKVTMTPDEQYHSYQSGMIEVWKVPVDVDKDQLMIWLDSDQGPNVHITDDMLEQTDVPGRWIIKNLPPQNVQNAMDRIESKKFRFQKLQVMPFRPFITPEKDNINAPVNNNDQSQHETEYMDMSLDAMVSNNGNNNPLATSTTNNTPSHPQLPSLTTADPFIHQQTLLTNHQPYHNYHQ